jgi:O-antigen ligase
LTVLRERIARSGWLIALAAMAILPSTTWTERIQFSVAGTPLQVRFVLYGVVAVIVAATAILSVGLRPRVPRTISIVAIAFIGWYVFTIALAGQPAREWLPSTLRWILFLSALITGIRAGKERPESVVQFRTVLVAALVLPVLVGLVQLITGSARILNNAPRISGTLLDHPVAFSLLLAVGLLVLIPDAVRRRRFRNGVLWPFLAVLFVEILFSFTRATIVAVIVVGLAEVLVCSRLMNLGRRVPLGAMATALILAAISLPFIQARAGSEPPMSVALPGEPSGPDAEPSATMQPIPFPIDNSTGLRFQTHAWGLTYIESSPIVGKGPGSFDRLFAADTGKVGVAAHDDFLLAAAETGIIGLLLLLVLYGVVARHGFTARNGSAPIQSHGIGILAAFGVVNVLLAIHNPTYFPEVQLPLWLGAGVAIGAASRQEPSGAKQTEGARETAALAAG